MEGIQSYKKKDTRVTRIGATFQRREKQRPLISANLSVEFCAWRDDNAHLTKTFISFFLASAARFFHWSVHAKNLMN